MADRIKKNKGNMYRKKGEEYVEEVLRKHDELHPAQNTPGSSRGFIK
jgi:hypothetical protein